MIGYSVYSFNWRDKGPAAGGNYEIPGRQYPTIQPYSVTIDELGLTIKYLDANSLKAFRQVAIIDLFNNGANIGHHFITVNLQGWLTTQAKYILAF